MNENADKKVDEQSKPKSGFGRLLKLTSICIVLAAAAITIAKNSGGNYTAMDVYQVLIGTGSKTLAQAGADAAAIFAQGAYR